MKQNFFDSFLNTLRIEMADLFGSVDDIKVSILMPNPLHLFKIDDADGNMCESVNNKNEKRAVPFIECSALISCPLGSMKVPFRPFINTDDFSLWALEDTRYSNNFITMYQVGYNEEDNSICCKNDWNEYCNFPLDVLEYTYHQRKVIKNGTEVIRWTLRKQLRENLEKIFVDTGIFNMYKSVEDMES